MDVTESILEAVRNAPEFSQLCDWHLTHLQENVYCLTSRAGTYFVKWIAPEDSCGQNEIRINQEILRQACLPVPRLLHVLQGKQGQLACWEWLDGTDLRFEDRHLLPQAFSSLARFHAQQRHHRAVISPTTRQAFATIEDLLEAELGVLCQTFEPATRARCKPYFDLLSACSYPTLIHGDMHPGNLRLTQRGLVFVDWSFALPSPNLFDLDYIQSVDLGDDMEWWDITPAEAEAILPAYFMDRVISAADIRMIHRAVMVWNQLHSHFNALSHANDAGARRCVENLTRLL